MWTRVTQSQAEKLLHNKFVVILGDSVQRSIYKDLVLLLQRDRYLTLPQLKTKGEFSFEQDSLVEGGRFGLMNNGTEYREVRQFRSDHHLLRFYFLTRIYSSYVESVLEDFRKGLKPDVLIVSSCVWDISRYGSGGLEQYKENLHRFFSQLKSVLPDDCLLLWNMAMPLGRKIKGGFLVPEVSHLAVSLRHDVIEANFYSCQHAAAYGLDVLDLHFHFRLRLHHRMPDGVHWDALAHRNISSLLLQHIAEAWGVDLHEPHAAPAQVFQCIGDSRHPRIRAEENPPRPPLNSDPQHRQQLLHHFRPHRNQLPPHGSGYFPLGLANPWLELRAHPYLIHGPPMDLRIPPGGGFAFPADDRCMRRRRRSNRTHPYPPPPYYVPPFHPAHRW